MGIVSGGGGGGAAFNGGTITAPLVIHSASDALAALDARAGSALTQGVRVQVDPGLPGLSVEGLGGFKGDINITDDVGSAACDVGTGGISLTANTNIVRQNTDFTKGSGLTTLGIWNAVHAAPTDGSLSAGDSYLWFDQSNGAAKLMVKAKQADGTVVTAAIALA